MEIWLIQNGKKTGPYQDYEIRSRITDGQIDPDVFAWHEGLPSWVKLREIELFRGDLERAELDKLAGPELNDMSQPPTIIIEVEKLHLARRFWARWMDLTMYAAIWWLLMYLAGQDIKAAILNPWIQVSLFMPWFAIEAWLLHKFGTTPGKWLLGIRVVNDDDTPLSLKSSTWRSFRVLIAGIGFGWGWLAILCQAMSWYTTRKIGKPVWDFMGKHKIVAAPLMSFKIIALIVIFFISGLLQSAVTGPHQQEIMIKQFPEFKEAFERKNPLYFPPKN